MRGLDARKQEKKEVKKREREGNEKGGEGGKPGKGEDISRENMLDSIYCSAKTPCEYYREL